MQRVLRLLPRVAPLVLRHLAAYVELTAADATALARLLTQRLIAAAVALLGAIFTLLMGCAWIVISVWDTQWRGLTIAALFLAFSAITVIGAMIAGRRWPAGEEPFSRLRDEWDSDQQLVREFSEPVES